MKSCSIPLHSTNHPFVKHIYAIYITCLLSHLVAMCEQVVKYHIVCVQVTFILLDIGHKEQE